MVPDNADDWTAYMDAHVKGNFAWCYFPWYTPSMVDINDWNTQAFPPDLNAYGNFVKDYLTEKAGGSIVPQKVAIPVANPSTSPVAPDTEITLTTTTESASIYYTLNGSTPTSNSTLYSDINKPVITVETTLKAIAVKSGMTDSDILTITYAISSSSGEEDYSFEGKRLLAFGDSYIAGQGSSQYGATAMPAVVAYLLDMEHAASASGVNYNNTGNYDNRGLASANTANIGSSNPTTVNATFTPPGYSGAPSVIAALPLILNNASESSHKNYQGKDCIFLLVNCGNDPNFYSTCIKFCSL